MSAGSKQYDPVEVAVLSADEVARARDEALAAIAAAGDLDELKAARLAHFGDRAPLTVASAEIGALPPAARAEATATAAGLCDAGRQAYARFRLAVESHGSPAERPVML